MAPNRKKRSRTRRKATKPRKTQLRKRPIQSKVQELAVSSTPPSMVSSSTKKDNVFEDDEDGVCTSTSNCSTPKGQRFRIPKIETCPPAPRKKPRMVSNSCLQRRPIAFFASPDIELFFYYAFRGISV